MSSEDQELLAKIGQLAGKNQAATNLSANAPPNHDCCRQDQPPQIATIRRAFDAEPPPSPPSRYASRLSFETTYKI
jgi:hypothetical protein